VPEKSILKQDKIYQSIGLVLAASQQPETIGSCLTPEKMNDLVNKRLNKNEYDSAIEHLDSCQVCYDQWLKLSLKAVEKNKLPNASTGVLMLILFWIVKNKLRFITYTSALLIIFFSWWYIQVPEIKMIQKLLNDSYITASLDKNDIDDLIIQVSLDETHKTNKALGFSDSIVNKKFRISFKSGIIFGRNIVQSHSGKSPVLSRSGEYPQNIYHWLGQCSFMTRAACFSETVPSDFWKKQKIIFAKLFKDYKTVVEKKSDEFNVVYKKLETVTLILGSENISKDQKQIIHNELTNIIEYLISDY